AAKKTPAKKTLAKKSPTKKSAAKKKSTAKNGGVKKARRWKAGTVALRRIRKYQKSTDLMMAKAPFQRLCKEITADITGRGDLRFQKSAILRVQEAAETHLTSMFECIQLAALHAKRVTIMTKDLQ
ncbi:histone-fold-containing protein, partial [Colletotrichum cereale]